MDNIFAKNVQRGDLIIIPFSNYLQCGIFHSYGMRGNPRYYSIWDGAYMDMKRRVDEHRRIYRTNLTRHHDQAIAALHPSRVSDALSEEYNRCSALLREYNYI